MTGKFYTLNRDRHRSGISDVLVLVGCVLVPGGRWVTWIVKRVLVLCGGIYLGQPLRSSK